VNGSRARNCREPHHPGVFFRYVDLAGRLPASYVDTFAIGVGHDFTGEKTRIDSPFGILEYDNALAKRSGIPILIVTNHRAL